MEGKINKSEEWKKTLERGLIPGKDGRKMSKSYGNTLSIFASEDAIRAFVMSIPTN